MINVVYIHSRKHFNQDKEKSVLYFDNSNIRIFNLNCYQLKTIILKLRKKLPLAYCDWMFC